MTRRRPNRPFLRQAQGESDLELYKLARAQIEHENTLVSQRITWFLTLQGFLFTAVFVAAANVLDPSKAAMHPTGRLFFAAAIGLLCVVGVVSSIACYLLIRAAYRQIDEVSDWWNGRGGRAERFPRISGQGGFDLPSYRVKGYRVTGADFSHVILLVWLTLLVLLIVAFSRGFEAGRAPCDAPVCCEASGSPCRSAEPRKAG